MLSPDCAGLQRLNWCVAQESNLVTDELKASLYAGFAVGASNFGETLAKNPAVCRSFGRPPCDLYRISNSIVSGNACWPGGEARAGGG
jgi:hypothetical protein